jgi:hypothetical protein
MTCLSRFFEETCWEGTATVIAGFITAVVVLIGFAIDRIVRRNSRRAEVYAGALQAVHDYLEIPYRICRSSGSAEDRFALVMAISDIQSRLSYYEGLLAMLAPARVLAGYRLLVEAARREAGTAMTDAWLGKPVRRNAQVPLGGALFPHSDSDDAREALLKLMR